MAYLTGRCLDGKSADPTEQIRRQIRPDEDPQRADPTAQGQTADPREADPTVIDLTADPHEAHPTAEDPAADPIRQAELEAKFIQAFKEQGWVGPTRCSKKRKM